MRGDRDVRISDQRHSRLFWISKWIVRSDFRVPVRCKQQYLNRNYHHTHFKYSTGTTGIEWIPIFIHYCLPRTSVSRTMKSWMNVLRACFTFTRYRKMFHGSELCTAVLVQVPGIVQTPIEWGTSNIKHVRKNVRLIGVWRSIAASFLSTALKI